MRFSVITMFPEFFESPLDVSLVGRAREAGIVDVDVIALRPYGLGRHQKLDGAPFGGGAGLVMRVEPLAAAVEPLADSHKVLLSAGGHRLTQATLDRFAELVRPFRHVPNVSQATIPFEKQRCGQTPALFLTGRSAVRR